VAPFGFEITKKVTWRGAEEKFSNVYHYNFPGGLDVEIANNVIDAIAAAEKPAFGSNVLFTEGRAWGPTDQGKAASNMVSIRDLSGAGSQAGTAAIPFELALVVQCYIGRGPAGRKQFLRKYLHICRASSGDLGDGGGLGNAAIGGNLLTVGAQYAARVKTVTAGSNSYDLCSPKGKLYTNSGGNWQVLPHLHVRQFRQ
jgi:hypothetical protein